MAVVIAIHEIEHVDAFWAAVRPCCSLGDATRLHVVYPLVNRARAVSVWEGPSADAVGDLVDAQLACFGPSEVYEVDTRPKESERSMHPAPRGRLKTANTS